MKGIIESFIGFSTFILAGLIALGIMKIYDIFGAKMESMYGFLTVILILIIFYLFAMFLLHLVVKRYAIRGVRGGVP